MSDHVLIAMEPIEIVKTETSISLCPFCDSNHLGIIEEESIYANKWFVWCHTCTAQGPRARTCEEAVKLWNKRAAV
jgi:Lar family restriction alleviation protein